MKKNYIMILIVALITIAGVAIAYAALSAVLTITTNKITQQNLTWQVGFLTGNVSGTPSGTSTDGIVCGTATVGANAITIADTTLSKPEDTCTYAFTIKNTGDISAKLNTIIPTSATGTGVSCTPTSATTTVGASMVCGNITYKITTDSAGTNPLYTGTILSATTGSQPVYLIVKYTGSTISENSIVQSGGMFTFTYAQN